MLDRQRQLIRDLYTMNFARYSWSRAHRHGHLWRRLVLQGKAQGSVLGIAPPPQQQRFAAPQTIGKTGRSRKSLKLRRGAPWKAANVLRCRRQKKKHHPRCRQIRVGAARCRCTARRLVGGARRAGRRTSAGSPRRSGSGSSTRVSALLGNCGAAGHAKQLQPCSCRKQAHLCSSCFA